MAAIVEVDPDVFLTQEYADNPYPTLKILRDHHPVYYNRPFSQWMVTRYEDVMNIFSDTENFSASPNGDHIGAVFGPTLMEYDGEDHRKLRALVAPQFVGEKMKALLPIVQRNAIALVEKFTEKHAAQIAPKRDIAKAQRGHHGQGPVDARHPAVLHALFLMPVLPGHDVVKEYAEDDDHDGQTRQHTQQHTEVAPPPTGVNKGGELGGEALHGQSG